MPSTTIEISREQRQPLHRLVTQHISGIGDVYLMIEQGDFATAERFGLEFGEDIQMLNDLGWNPDDAQDSYALTQPRHELIEALKRLRLDAEDGLDAPEDEKRKREEYDELIAYFTRARDLCAELIDAHVRPPAGTPTALSPEGRLRATSSGVLACWIAFAAAGFGFYKTTEDHPFSKAGDAHLALGDAHVAIQVLAVLASIAVLAGALPLVMTALRQARQVRPLRLAAGLAIGGVALFAISTAALVLLAHSARSISHTMAGAAFLAWILVGLLSGGACAFAARNGLFAMRVRRRGLVAALACGTLVTAAMALMSIATAIYAVALAFEAPGLAGAGNGPFGLLGAGLSIGFQLVVMLFTAGLAVVSLRRGWSAIGAGVEAAG
jgi:hypothetical protein